MAEPFDIKKFFDLSPTALGKSISIGWKLLLVLLVIFTIYRAWIIPKQKQTQQITVESGGQATIIQKQDRKRFLIPFVEGFVEQSRNNQMNTGIRAGLRFEF